MGWKMSFWEGRFSLAMLIDPRSITIVATEKDLTFDHLLERQDDGKMAFLDFFLWYTCHHYIERCQEMPHLRTSNLELEKNNFLTKLVIER